MSTAYGEDISYCTIKKKAEIFDAYRTTVFSLRQKARLPAGL